MYNNEQNSVGHSPMPLSDAEWTGFDRYDWNSDVDFVDGLNSVIAAKRANGTEFTADELEIVELKAKMFFYSRKIQKQVEYDGYMTWKNRHSATPEATQDTPSSSSTLYESASNTDHTDGSPDSTPYPSSFAHIVELILAGKPIPGIKQIPNILLGETASSASEQPSRKKPWEK
ncbi:hypothetical protein V1512DRAFT_224597 [Lipomyces arxii]|uniref:uncharacterized protein n=1 Tax=Lipomyces arxii TaxID=56418 RepID=UPI0034CE3CA1